MLVAIIVPIVMIEGVIITFYARHTMNGAIEQARSSRMYYTINAAKTVRTMMENMATEAQMIASIVTSEGNPSAEIFRMMDIHQDVFGVSIGYAPEFLDALRGGHYPEYHLENYFGLLPTDGSIPERFAPTINRQRQDGQLTTVDFSQFAYEMQPWYLAPKLTQRTAWSDPIPAAENRDIQVFSYSIPIYHDGYFMGVVAVAFQMSKFIAQIEILDKSQMIGGKTLLLYENGRFFYHSDEARWRKISIYSALDQSRKDELFPLFDKMLSGNTGIIQIPKWGKGIVPKEEQTDTWFIFTPVLANSGLTLVATFREQNVLAETRLNIVFLYLAALLSVILLILFTTFIVFRIYNPILAITSAVVRVTLGDFNVEIPKQYTNRRSVIGEHARAFEQMIRSLDRSEKRANKETQIRTNLENDLEAAREIQESLLPNEHLPVQTPTYILDAFLHPAKFVAGDFFDFWQVDQDNIAFLVADVSGKGIPASLVMVEIRMIIRLVSDLSKSPDAILSRVNAIVQPTNKLFMFTTLIFAFYNTKTGQLRYCNAGHIAPAILRSGGSVIWQDDIKNPVLGIMANVVFTTSELTLQPGDSFFLYTDGVVDSQMKDGEPFGNERLKKMVAQIAGEPAPAMIPQMFNTLKEYSHGSQKDDITMLVLQRQRGESK